MKYNLSPEKSRRPGIAKSTGVALTTAASLAVAACGHASGQSHNNGRPQNTPVGVETTQDDGGQGGGEGTFLPGTGSVLKCVATALRFRYDVATPQGTATDILVTYHVTTTSPDTRYTIVSRSRTPDGPTEYLNGGDDPNIVAMQVDYAVGAGSKGTTVDERFYGDPPRILTAAEASKRPYWDTKTVAIPVTAVAPPSNKANALALAIGDPGSVQGANQYTMDQAIDGWQAAVSCEDNWGEDAVYGFTQQKRTGTPPDAAIIGYRG